MGWGYPRPPRWQDRTLEPLAAILNATVVASRIAEDHAVYPAIECPAAYPAPLDGRLGAIPAKRSRGCFAERGRSCESIPSSLHSSCVSTC